MNWRREFAFATVVALCWVAMRNSGLGSGYFGVLTFEQSSMCAFVHLCVCAFVVFGVCAFEHLSILSSRNWHLACKHWAFVHLSIWHMSILSFFILLLLLLLLFVSFFVDHIAFGPNVRTYILSRDFLHFVFLRSFSLFVCFFVSLFLCAFLCFVCFFLCFVSFFLSFFLSFLTLSNDTAGTGLGPLPAGGVRASRWAKSKWQCRYPHHPDDLHPNQTMPMAL